MVYSEIQMFLVGFIIIEICEIFTVGGIPLEDSVRKVRAFIQLNHATKILTLS